VTAEIAAHAGALAFFTHLIYCRHPSGIAASIGRLSPPPSRRKDARMDRLAVVLLFLLPASIHGQSAPENNARVGKALAVQQAMSTAREHLKSGKPADAVAVLEAEILYVNGNSTYLALMKEAYVACLKDQRERNAEPERQEHVRRQLRILDPTIKIDEVTAPAKPTAEPMLPMVKQPISDGDPFEQTPLDRQQTSDWKAQATAAFEKKRYSEAASLFDQARQAKVDLTAEEQQAFAYCRLHDVVTRLNSKTTAGSSLATLQSQAEDAAKLGGPSLAKFADQVLTEIRKRKSETNPVEATAIPDGWQAIEGGSFRVLFLEARPRAQEIAKAAEQVRVATFEKWSGPAGADWSPRCDIWLHTNAADYAKATGKPATSPGHASIGINGGRIHARRIDVRCDDPTMLDVTLPREVAYAVLADLFPEQPLPRWADVGITMLAMPEAEIARYRRALPKLAQDRKLFAVRDFLKMADFPDAERITPFYVESVSLVDYLVRLKGAKAFALYLREAPRRGYEEALQRHYGFKDAAELQERWIRAATSAE
jgi:hypothetical protein